MELSQDQISEIKCKVDQKCDSKTPSYQRRANLMYIARNKCNEDFIAKRKKQQNAYYQRKLLKLKLKQSPVESVLLNV